MNYKQDLVSRFWEYQSAHFGDRPALFERSNNGSGRPPVFVKDQAHHNVIVSPAADARSAGSMLGLIPYRERHKWFGSMSSSQALAQSVFGNLAANGALRVLYEVSDDDGRPLLDRGLGLIEAFGMETKVSHLGEPRPTSIDVSFFGARRVAIECKLTESDIGTCSRPRLGQDRSDCCSGAYSFANAKAPGAPTRTTRCPLTAIGVKYWEYVPQIFEWPSTGDVAVCPLNTNYQLVRNVLAASVREDGTVSPTNGRVVLVYDDRNPAFQEGGAGLSAYLCTKSALLSEYSGALSKCPWQRILMVLRSDESLRWLTYELGEKYGL
jgi:hypothetical protein